MILLVCLCCCLAVCACVCAYIVALTLYTFVWMYYFLDVWRLLRVFVCFDVFVVVVDCICCLYFV